MRWFATLLLAGCATTVPNGTDWPDAPPMMIAPVEVEAAPILAHEPRHEHFANPEGHYLGVFLGGVFNRGVGDGFTFGVDYEYRLNKKWGVGGFVHVVAIAANSAVVGINGFYHATERLALVGGFGAEIPNRGSTDFLLRFGATYDFEAGEILITPALYLDIVEGGHVAGVLGIVFMKKL